MLCFDFPTDPDMSLRVYFSSLHLRSSLKLSASLKTPPFLNQKGSISLSYIISANRIAYMCRACNWVNCNVCHRCLFHLGRLICPSPPLQGARLLQVRLKMSLVSHAIAFAQYIITRSVYWHQPDQGQRVRWIEWCLLRTGPGFLCRP